MNMWQRNDKNEANRKCGEFELLLVISAAGEELSPIQQESLAAHLSECANCAAVLDRDKEMLRAFSAHEIQPEPALLAECRLNLQDALDREEDHGRLYHLVEGWIPSSWISPRPAWSAAVLLIIGFSVGMLGPHFLLDDKAGSTLENGNNNTPLASNLATVASKPGNAPSSTLSSLDFHPADVAGLNIFPSGSDNLAEVQLRLKAQSSMLQGTVNDDGVKAALLHILAGNEAFGPEMRLQVVDLLRERNNDPEIRKALCHAVHQDGNAAVRLKALEALDGSEPQDIVRQTLLDALVDDQNPGVRVEAINELRDMTAKGQVVSDDHMISVLRERMEKDPSTYIRLQSAAAMRDLGWGQKF